MYQYSL